MHSIGMRFVLDVAHLDIAGTVLAIDTLGPQRLGRVYRGSVAVVEAEAGQFGIWGVRKGSRLTLLPAAQP